MASVLRPVLLGVVAVAGGAALAGAQTQSPLPYGVSDAPEPATPQGSTPHSTTPQALATPSGATPTPATPTTIVAPQTGAPPQTNVTPQAGVAPQTVYPAPSGDAQNVLAAFDAARSGQSARIRSAMDAIYDPLARRIALWELIDAAPNTVSFAEADAARRDLAGWPREMKREEAAETLLSQSGLSQSAIVAWFGGRAPRTGEGALALARALNATGQPAAAAALIRDAWRSKVFDQNTQGAMIGLFGSTLSPDDYAAREDLLLYGAHDGAAQDLLRFLSADQQALAQARMAVRRGDPNAATLIAALPVGLQNAPGLIYERVLELRDSGQEASARQLVGALPEVLPDPSAAEHLWKHGALAIDALRDGDSTGAYAVAAHSGLSSGPAAAEAQFLAGWIALTRLKDPALADTHFAKVADAGGSPLTQSRAYYWRGRASEAAGDPVNAQLFFSQAARFTTTFYGQLAAEREGVTTLTLGHDPAINAGDRATFDALEPIRAMRYLAAIGAKDEFRLFAADLADIMPNAADEAMLTDLVRGYGDQEAAMRVVRNAAKRGFILPERGYPIVTQAAELATAEPALVLGVTRQESSFDPRARSGAGARGMMQLMPGTAEVLARRLGLSFSTYELEDPQYNMRLGSAYLGQLVGQFGGSYIMAAAAYNAGPGRPTQWTTSCGDPRSAATDPLNYIECIPFSETRDYVMRVMEATQVYRARLNGGSAPLTLQSDLRRGAYGYP